MRNICKIKGYFRELISIFRAVFLPMTTKMTSLPGTYARAGSGVLLNTRRVQEFVIMTTLLHVDPTFL